VTFNAAWVAAAEGLTVDLDFITPFLQGGFIGLLFIMAMVRKGIVFERELKAKEEEVRELKATITEKDRIIDRQTVLLEEKIIPAMTRAADISASYAQFIARRGGGDGGGP
jgi:hypothetical protein